MQYNNKRYQAIRQNIQRLTEPERFAASLVPKPNRYGWIAKPRPLYSKVGLIRNELWRLE